VADLLVRSEIIDRADRDLEAPSDAADLVHRHGRGARRPCGGTC